MPSAPHPHSGVPAAPLADPFGFCAVELRRGAWRVDVEDESGRVIDFFLIESPADGDPVAQITGALRTAGFAVRDLFAFERRDARGVQHSRLGRLVRCEDSAAA